ncbi:MAG: FUSC family protein, partial [Comamonas sp.]|nr:FUSC family protein [Comamonas sp.]
MSVAAYDRLLEGATRWGFDSARLRQHLRTAFAACIAVFAAWALGLEHPQWAGMTVWAASQPLRGQLLEKSFFRTTGTLVGTAAGVVLVLVADGDLLWLVTGLAVWIGICAGLGNLQRSFASYGTMLAGYSASMVALLDNGNPAHVYALGWDRLFTALTGVAAALVVGWLFTPVGAEIPGDGRVRRLCARLLRDIADAAQATASGHSAL